jgi:hypothetical protein
MNYKFPQVVFENKVLLFKGWSKKDLIRFKYLCKKMHKRSIRGFVIWNLYHMAGKGIYEEK